MSITAEDISRFHDSLDRASADEMFLDLFYEGFLSSSDEVVGFFSNSDMERLKRKLKASLQMMTRLVDDVPGADMYMGHLSRVHDRYHIPPQMYYCWLDALIDTVSRCDEEFDSELERIWREVIGGGIAIMIEGAHSWEERPREVV